MAEAKAKKNIFKSIAKFFKEIKSEMKKVTWPTRDQLIRQTLVVVVSIIIIGAFIFLLDLLFGYLSTTFITR